MEKTLIVAVVVAVLVCFLLIAGVTAVKAETTVVKFEDMDLNEVYVQGFELLEKGKLDIESMGLKVRYSSDYSALGWIIDAEDREIVWTMNSDCDDEDDVSSILTECGSYVTLRPGRYEAYYYAGKPTYFSSGYNISINDLGDLIEVFGDAFNQDEYGERDFDMDDLEELYFHITTDAKFKSYTPTFEKPANSFVFINQPKEDEYLSQGFTLDKEANLQIYAIGEYSESYDIFVDGAWIIDADTRNVVWTMDKWNTDRAGGANKNRYYLDETTLPAGDYIAYYATDDSHDSKRWNAVPPGDPFNYGITISVVNKADLAAVSEYTDNKNEVLIAKLTRMRNDDFEKVGFELKHDSKIHIYGLGERNYSKDNLVDYGWISDAETMERVWEMDINEMTHAGGAAKNAMFDGIIGLPAGKYIVYYKTDDSHSYGDWNATAPFDRKSWGIALYGHGDKFTEDSFTLFDEFEGSENILVNLTGLGDDEHVRRRFSLDDDTKVRIIALGEGKYREMYDYGWIENEDTGEIVWEMTYRKTRHGGGADKNRLAISNINLEKGNYIAYFVTDDSHSFERFNASAPDEPEKWGMIISKK